MSISLFYIDTLRKIEIAAQHVLPPRTLMQRAGFAAARTVLEALPTHSPSSRILVLAGPGNNGGDGFESAVHLRLAGHHVAVLWCGKEESNTETPTDLNGAIEAWKAIGGTILREWPTEDNQNWDAIVDALFGIGLMRPISGSAREWILKANTCSAFKLAIDIPSGLCANTGCILGGKEGVVFKAHHTITFIGNKPGLHTLEGIEATGTLSVDTLQIPIKVQEADGFLTTTSDFNFSLPSREANAHKGMAGNLLVIGGAPGMTGALNLAARAGLHAGAGKVYVMPCPVDLAKHNQGNGSTSSSYSHDPLQPELLIRRFETISDIQTIRPSAVVIGMGMGQSDVSYSLLKQTLSYLSETRCPVLLDADALNLLAGDTALETAVKALPSVILTPHPLEAARLLGLSIQEVQANRIQTALSLAQRYQAIIILKGAGSIMARPDGTWTINPTGCAALATGGTGDVLSGWIGGLLAQTMPEWEATLSGTWIHGRAAEQLTDELGGILGITASEIILAARKELNRLTKTKE